ncbi:hypothetical protein [Zhongshania sp. BJYM1]|jgi:hypothetical protein|uniref:hypothetical protein n=1 Tax=Zhongshania aquatica TaxID=2965069 RepID=UPI0022B39DE5|nr:hypothetical protein [Marortus sp. BJYM1]
MRAIYLVWLGVVFVASSQVQAGDLSESYNVMCEKMKSCAMKSIGEADLTPDMRAMITASLENTCQSIEQQFPSVAAAHPLYGPASACLSSMGKLSCDQIENMGDTSTPECERYEKMVENYE